ncbi:MAG: hypothetical protein V3T30_04245, partial [Thermodesulfobacteriota bacterium]
GNDGGGGGGAPSGGGGSTQAKAAPVKSAETVKTPEAAKATLPWKREEPQKAPPQNTTEGQKAAEEQNEAHAAPEDAEKDVAGFIDFIVSQKKDRLMASALPAESISVSGGSLNVVSGKSDKFIKDHSAELEKYSLEYFGRLLKVSVTEAGAPGKPDEPGEGGGVADESSKKKQLEPSSKSNTLVKEAVDIFGGRVIEDNRNTGG